MSFIAEAPIAIVQTNLKFTIEEVNAATCILFKKTRQEIIGKNLLSLLGKDERLASMFIDPETSAVAEGTISGDNGRKLNVRVQVSKHLGSYCWFIENRTEINQLKAQLEGLKKLPREYGHDINNLLTVILSAAQMIQFDTPEDHELQEDISDIIKASNRAAAQTRMFMNLGRHLVIDAKPLNVDEKIKSKIELLNDILGSDSKLTFDFRADDGDIHAPEATFLAAVYHLFIHFRAKRHSGDFVFETRIVDIDDFFANHTAGISDGKYVVLSLREKDFPMNDFMLSQSSFYEPDESTSLTHTWEGIIQSRGSIVQRMDKYKKLCISLYFPDISQYTVLESL